MMRSLQLSIVLLPAVAHALLAGPATVRGYGPRRHRVATEMAPIGEIMGLVDADLVMAAGAAVVGAVGGVAVGRNENAEEVAQLMASLAAAQETLVAVEANYTTKVDELEDKLFAMDMQFEQQSVKVQQQSDTQLRDELASLRFTLQKEFGNQHVPLRHTHNDAPCLRSIPHALPNHKHRDRSQIANKAAQERV